MKRILMTILGSAIAMAFVAAAIGQTTDPSGADKNAAANQSAPATPPASTKAPDSGSPTATPAPDANAAQTTPAPAAASATGSVAADAAVSAEAGKKVDRVKERGMKVSAKERAQVEKQLDEVEKQVENEGTSKGDAEVAGRIATEFGMTPDALTAERAQYGRGWGELVVAHTLQANAKSDVTVADLFDMRAQGMGWGQIAAGLGLKLGAVVPAVKAEGRVALGLEKGDGKVATIAAAGMGAKAKGAGSAKAGAKVSGKGGTTAAGAGVGVGAGVDLKGTGK